MTDDQGTAGGDPPHQQDGDGATLSVEERVARLEELAEGLAWSRFYELAETADGAAEALRGQVRYARGGSDGWLVVLINGARVALPSGLEVTLINTAQGRDYGVVKEGVLTGKSFDVSSGNLTASYRRLSNLKANVVRRAGGAVVIGGIPYELELSLAYRDGAASGSAGPFPAKTHPANPVPLGDHDIEIADFPHPAGAGYGTFGTVWFRIGHSGDRYIHPGRISAGCLTCAPQNWSEIYQILHCARIDTRSVGRMNVASV